MTKISNFHINTHFTALKQLPEKYQASIQIAGRTVPAYTLGVLLGTTIIEVPAGIYVENVITRTSIDGWVNHLTPQFYLALGEQGYFYISLNQVSNDKYELSAKMENYSSSPLVLPACSTEAILRLAIAPF